MLTYKNKVELIGHYGGDITHALSAWCSTSRELTPEKIKRIPELLENLAENQHGTPFEKSMLHFLVTTDIATHIHLLKHRIGVPINAESARYKELKDDKFYLPEDWINNENVKNTGWLEKLLLHTEQGIALYHDSLKELTPILGRKRAKESCRYFNSYNIQLTADVSFNWRSFYHFYNLRSDTHAQLEIQEIANQMLQLIKNIENNPFEHTLHAFNLTYK